MTILSRRAGGTLSRIALVAATLGLAGCIIQESDPRFGPGPGGGGPRVEGNWAPSDGRAIATFQNGAFVNRAVDTGQPFTAGGRYSYTGPNQVAISYTSVVRQTQVNVNCFFASAGQLDCSTADGAQFSLFRRA